MKILVVGCGAMGSIYAALFADAGHDVAAIDPWPEHVQAIMADGLRVEGASGDRTVRIAASTDFPSGPFDLVIVAVKAAHVADVAPKLASVLAPWTIVLTIQNGVGSADQLAKIVPGDRLAVGIAGGFGAIMRGPGHAFHNGMNVIRIGAYRDLPFSDVEAVVAAWCAACFRAEAVRDVIAMQWEKLICNVAYSAPCALTGMTVGEVMYDPDLGPVSREAATEAWTAGRALNIAIVASDPVKLARDFAAPMPGARPSMLQDHENKKHSEIDVINGAVLRASDRTGVPCPVNRTLVALVKQRERDFIR